MNTREKIIEGCLELFYKYGIKSITVDDISAHLCISKKTFYQYFENKNDIVKAITNKFLEKIQCNNAIILNENADVFDKLIKIYKGMLFQFYTCNPRFIYDLKKFNPDAFNLVVEFCDQKLDSIITNLIKQGKDEGWFRKEIDENIIFKLFLNRIATIIEGSLLPEKNITDPIFLNFMVMDLVSITTIEGHKRLDEKLNDYKI